MLHLLYDIQRQSECENMKKPKAKKKRGKLGLARARTLQSAHYQKVDDWVEVDRVQVQNTLNNLCGKSTSNEYAYTHTHDSKQVNFFHSSNAQTIATTSHSHVNFDD